MTPTTLQRQQHLDLLDLVKRIGALAGTAASASAQAGEIRSLLNQLSGKIAVHLAGEDKVIYPRLIASSDPQISATARRFQQEMGGLVTAFQTFSTTWSEAAIRADGARFLTDLGGIVRALGARIDKEDHQLYPLADRA